MSLRRRGNTWWVDITTPGGQRIRESAETPDRKAAQEYHDRLKAEGWRRHKLGDKPQRTWDEAALRFLKELGGWETLEMVNRYAHLAPEHLKAHAERLSIGSGLTAQIRHSDDVSEKTEVAVSN